MILLWFEVGLWLVIALLTIYIRKEVTSKASLILLLLMELGVIIITLQQIFD